MHDDTVDLGRVLLVAMWICLSAASWFGQSTSAVAADTTSAIIVDAATTVAESDGGDDLATLQNIFQDANAPQDGTIAPMDQMISDLKMKRMRILQGDGYCDLDGDGNFVTIQPGEFDLLSQQIDWALQHGLSPHVAVASTLPRSFVPYGPAETWPQPILDRYKSYALQLVRYIVERSFNGGARSVIFEVSNELDIADYAPLNFNSSNPPDASRFALLPLGPWGRFLWWIDPATYNLREWPPTGNAYPYGGDPRRASRGITPMQKIFGDAIQAVRTEAESRYSGRTVQIAGPAFAGFTFQWAEDPNTHAALATLDEQFLDTMFDRQTDSGRYNSALDYVSFHYYGDFRGGWAGRTTTLNYITSRLRAKLAALGHPETRLFLSEWGPSTDQSSDINYSHKGAAWVAAFLVEAVADRIAIGSYLIMHDAVGHEPGDVGQASLMSKVVTGDSTNYYPKPPANVFKMFAMMTGTRRAVTTLAPAASASLGAFAANDATSAGIVIFNYNSSFSDTAETFSVQWNNLPIDGVVTVERYLIDANTSNLQAYLTKPGQPDPHLQKVEQFSAQVYNGQLILPARSLGLGVTFWRISS